MLVEGWREWIKGLLFWLANRFVLHACEQSQLKIDARVEQMLNSCGHKVDAGIADKLLADKLPGDLLADHYICN